MKELQDWVGAYKEISDAILAPGTGIAEVKHVDMWHEQIDFLPEEYPWPPGSVFLEFNIDTIETTGMKVQDMNCEISVYYALDTISETHAKSDTKDIALAFGNHLRKIHKFLQGRSGVNFGNLNRTGIRRVPAPQYLMVYKQMYSCVIRDESAMDEFGEATIKRVKTNKLAAPTPADLGMFKMPD